MNDEKKFAERVKQLRITVSLTQQQLGEAVGLSKQAINDIEQGRKQTRIDKAIAIARLFNTTVDYLVGDTDNPVRPSEVPFVEHLFAYDEGILLSRRIKPIREKLGVSHQDVGKETLMGTRRYRRIETADDSPSIFELKKLCNYFNISADYLLGLTDEPRPLREENISSDQKQ